MLGPPAGTRTEPRASPGLLCSATLSLSQHVEQPSGHVRQPGHCPKVHPQGQHVNVRLHESILMSTFMRELS